MIVWFFRFTDRPAGLLGGEMVVAIHGGCCFRGTHSEVFFCGRMVLPKVFEGNDFVLEECLWFEKACCIYGLKLKSHLVRI